MRRGMPMNPSAYMEPNNTTVPALKNQKARFPMRSSNLKPNTLRNQKLMPPMAANPTTFSML